MPNSSLQPSEPPHAAARSEFQPIETEGFPWTGLTLVLVVIGLVAFMAVPSVPSSPKAREALRTKTDATFAVGEVRASIRDYFHDHRAFPGQNPRAHTRSEGSQRWLERQLMLNTDDAGNPAGGPTPEHSYGPYLPRGIPVNPINQLSTVMFAESPETFEPDDSTGWVFFQSEGLIRLNTSSKLRRSSLRFYDL